MRDMFHSICFINLYQITMRKKFRFFVSDCLKQMKMSCRYGIGHLMTIVLYFSDIKERNQGNFEKSNLSSKNSWLQNDEE